MLISSALSFMGGLSFKASADRCKDKKYLGRLLFHFQLFDLFLQFSPLYNRNTNYNRPYNDYCNI
ncbi:hypothetical protein SAMN05421640_2412 [Ekhidna lutea]|uniref:Uncharacterized protein n=1 Tax=Ekhidna lutea TaxID=447679 RepID=A0A239K4A2_EKHLU|nr:hypothetical protein SAMN05421640_2412 [Ekhidna lutea]